MKLFEYQAKEIFAQAGIDVPKSQLIEMGNELPEAIAICGLPCMLKSQVLSGGRGKAGLIRLARTEAEAAAMTDALFQGSIPVRKILVEQAVNIDSEIYLAVTFDPVCGQPVIMGSAEGGMDIETIAATVPEKIIREAVDIDSGLQPFQVNDFVYRLGFQGDTFKKISRVVRLLYEVFRKNDAELVEINPLFLTREGDVVAGDGKLIIDDNSMFRQKKFEKSRDHFENDIAYEAALEGIPYLQFDGDISLMCAGAGLANTVYDLINDEGGKTANYLEFGGPNYRKSKTAMELCLKNDSKVILIVTFGTIARADVMAQGIVDAISELRPDRPIVTCIRGTGEEEAREILAKAGLSNLTDTEEAVRKAIAIAKGGMEE